MPTADTCIVADENLEMAAAGPVAMQNSADFSSAAAAARKSDQAHPCPRCESLDTKFCYFNNYNVNQPRYFCRRCQRYWTAGGSLRNLPVGAGRRKHKRPQTKCHEDIGTAFDNIMSFSGPTVVESNRSVHDETLALKESRLSHQNPSHYIHKHSLNHSQRHKDSIQKALQHEDEDSHPKVWPDSFKEDLTCQSSSSSADKAPTATASATASRIENPDNGSTQQFGLVSPPSMCPWPMPWPYANVMPMPAGMMPAQAGQVAAAAASVMWAGAATAASLLQFHPMWRPMEWNPVAWNTMASGNHVPTSNGNPASDVGNCPTNQPQRSHDQESLCIPKSLKIGDPNEVVHSSILTTLGLSSSPSSTTPKTPSSAAYSPHAAGFFNLNAMPKPDDTQSKSPAASLSAEERTKLQKMNQNPAAHARSLAFQEKN